MNRRDERILRTTTLFEKDNIQLGLINSGRKKLKNKDKNIFYFFFKYRIRIGDYRRMYKNLLYISVNV